MICGTMQWFLPAAAVGAAAVGASGAGAAGAGAAAVRKQG